MIVLSRRFAMPTLQIAPIKPVLRFGLLIQATGLVLAVRDQAVIAGALAIAGTAAVGLWALAARFLAIPSIIVEALARVGYPAMARRLERGGDIRPFVTRFTAALSVGVGLVTVLVVSGAKPGIPALLGSKWEDVALALRPFRADYAFEGPVRVAASTYLYALGDAGYLKTDIAQALVVVVSGLVLVALFEAPGLAVAYSLGAATRAVLLARTLHARHDIAVGRAVVIPTIAVAAVTVPLFAASSEEPSFVQAALTLTGGVAYCVLISLIYPRAVRDLIGLGRRAAPASATPVSSPLRDVAPRAPGEQAALGESPRSARDPPGRRRMDVALRSA